MMHPTPVQFTSPLISGTTNYSQFAFETDLPAIEVKGPQDRPPFCNPKNGSNCVNPPRGAQFYPFFTTGFQTGTCIWREGVTTSRAPSCTRRQLDLRVRSGAEEPVSESRFHGRVPNRVFNSGSQTTPCQTGT
jgi:hypothetical protein